MPIATDATDDAVTVVVRKLSRRTADCTHAPGSLFVNRWILSLVVALWVLDGEVQAYRYFKKVGHHFRPVMMKPMPVGRFGFVRAENPNADGAMDAPKSGEESFEAAPSPQFAMEAMPGQEMHAPEMREMIHDSPHPVEIDMGPGMQARIMGFEGELDHEGNFGRAAADGEEDEEGGAQFRHFKHKHKKHKHVIHTHHHYHHKKEGHGGGYGHHGYGKHDSYGHHGHGHGHGHHGGDDEGDDYEPTYGHHGRYRRSSMSEMSPEEGPDAQALDRTALAHSSPDLPVPLEPAPAMVDPSTPTVYRQSVSRRQLVRSKNERLAQIGRDRAQRANRYADEEHDSDGPCPVGCVEAVGEVVGSERDGDVKVASNKRPAGPIQSIISRMFRRPKKQEAVVTADAQKPLDPQTKALREEIQKATAGQQSNIGTEMKQYIRTKEVVGGPQATNVHEEPASNSTAYVAQLPGSFLPELGTIVSVRFVDESGRERSIPFELTSYQLPNGNGTAVTNQTIPLNYNFFYFHCLSPNVPAATTANGDRLRSMAKRMIEGLEGGRKGRTTDEEEGAAVEGSVPQRWLHRRRTKSEWRRRDMNAGRRRRPMPVEKVIERRTPEELPMVMVTPAPITPEVSETEQVEDKETEEERDDEYGCDDPICSNFYVDEQKLTTTSTTPRTPEHRLEEELEPRLLPYGNRIDEQGAGLEDPLELFVSQQREEVESGSKPTNTRNSLWRGLSKRLSAFRERQADRSGRRKMVNLPETTTTTTANPTEEDEYGSNEIVEYYQQDVGRVLYRMANGRLLEEPQRLHLRRSAEVGDESDSPLRKRRLNRLNNRAQRRRKPAKANAITQEPKTPEASNDGGKHVINIGTFRLADSYDGGAAAALENTGAARSVSGPTPTDMDNYILQKVREYCTSSCTAGKPAAPVIIVPEKPSYHVAYAAPAAGENEPIVGSSKQLIVQPASTYEAAPTSAPNTASPPTCPTKIVKCIPKALANGKRSRKAEPADEKQEDKESNPLVSLARGSMIP
uniref:Uncharacterized protein n=1 Tax=Anopheles minimus TaxID=112268 RepID=A0A182W1G3_9DIPT